MRTVPKPDLNKIDIYNECTSSIRNPATRESLNKYLYTYLLNVASYEYKASNKSLFELTDLIEPVLKSKDYPFGVTSVSLKKLYSSQMVPEQKPARKYYDILKSLPKRSRCPFCGIGIVETLDHYLPKSVFPIFSILPNNLIACCRDCNSEKSIEYATTKSSQTLHPYYDDFSNKQWLFSKVIQTPAPAIMFYVNPPITWSGVDRDRVESHFTCYSLNRRYSIQAANELGVLMIKLIQYEISPVVIRKLLEEKYNIYKSICLNSWETAMYQALYQDDWYCNVGYKVMDGNT